MFSGGFFLGVFFHPGFPAFAGGSVAAGEGEGGDVGVRDGGFFVGVFRVEADHRVLQRFRGAAVEEVALDFGSVFAGDGDVSAVVEGFFEGLAKVFFVGERRDPAFEVFMGRAGGDLEGVGIGVGRVLFGVAGFFACHGRLFCQGSINEPDFCYFLKVSSGWPP